MVSLSSVGPRNIKPFVWTVLTSDLFVLKLKP